MLTTISIVLAWLNNNLGLITLLGGGTAIALYIKQKREYKRDVAKLILQEIRYAEQQIRVAREHDHVFQLPLELLPTNTWYQNIHLFIKEIKETEIDLISNFYSRASYIDTVIKTISQYKNNQKIMLEPPAPITLQHPQQTIDVSQPTGGQMIVQSQQPTIVGIQQTFRLAAEDLLKLVSSKIEFIYNTPAIDKLRSISEKKWYKIL